MTISNTTRLSIETDFFYKNRRFVDIELLKPTFFLYSNCMSSHHHHNEEHFLQSASLRDFVIGLSDGLTVPFALAAGLSGAVATSGIIITAGVAEIVAGSIAMGLGGYLGGRSEIEHYESELQREYAEVEEVPDEEKTEVRKIFAEYGMDATAQEAAVNSLAKNKHKWVEFMMRFELGLEKPDPSQAYYSAFRIGGGYALGGTIPLIPYLFTQEAPQTGLAYSAIVTIFSLLIFGYFKSHILGQRPIWGAIKIASIGAIAAACAFTIARLTQQFI